MEKSIVILPKTKQKVKGIIDTIYELTKETPYKGTLHSGGARFSHVATILCKRGCLIRSGDRRNPSYTWNPQAMAPTRNFYNSIVEQVVLDEREWKDKHIKKKKEMALMETETKVIENNVIETISGAESSLPPSLESFSDKELLDELYRRGW